MMIVAMLVATASYIPVGALSSKIGRKRVILGGVVLMGLAFAGGIVLTHYSWVAYVLMGIIGIGWAAINVNSYPMVVEMSRGSDVGKYTGYYYTFSMAAQVVTPVLAGTLMRTISYKILFPYAAVFVSLSFVTMCFVRHGDGKAEAKTGLSAFEDID